MATACYGNLLTGGYGLLWKPPNRLRKRWLYLLECACLVGHSCLPTVDRLSSNVPFFLRMYLSLCSSTFVFMLKYLCLYAQVWSESVQSSGSSDEVWHLDLHAFFLFICGSFLWLFSLYLSLSYGYYIFTYSYYIFHILFPKVPSLLMFGISVAVNGI